ncbi:hypothetical protein EGR_08572 [Echinococcus granulosus]|uniref:Uncharacterized protein n=1 Tax=Echinococcus granulosus TaxID=6210 RepID=W6U858_ECHGR|nr:hypothetical protein EGR_08572 [Echinococcus granulosus]EUB56546.1 hypothetical protein EGR_08572 [Echinococcus granulosus]
MDKARGKTLKKKQILQCMENGVLPQAKRAASNMPRAMPPWIVVNIDVFAPTTAVVDAGCCGTDKMPA